MEERERERNIERAREREKNITSGKMREELKCEERKAFLAVDSVSLFGRRQQNFLGISAALSPDVGREQLNTFNPICIQVERKRR